VSRRIIPHPSVEEVLSYVPPGLYAQITATIDALADAPEPIGSRPFGGIENAMRIDTEAFTLIYTYGDKDVSLWVLRVNT
jgi:hypothetical protein